MAIFFRVSNIHDFVALEKSYQMSNTKVLVISIFMTKYLLKDKNRKDLVAIVRASISDLYHI